MGFANFSNIYLSSVSYEFDVPVCAKKKFSVLKEKHLVFVQTFTKRTLNCRERHAKLNENYTTVSSFPLSQKNVNDALFVKMVEFDIINNYYEYKSTLIVIRKMTFFGDPCKKMRHDDVFCFRNGNYYIKDRWQILSKFKDFVASFFEIGWISSEILKKSWHELSRRAPFCF